MNCKPSACFNPLAVFDPASPDLTEDVATLADALVFDPPGEAGEAGCGPANTRVLS